MDRQRIEDENIVERYVTGRLSATEAASFEEYFLEHPEYAAEVEAAQRLHRGLETLAAKEAVRTSLKLSLWNRLLHHPFTRLVPLLLLAALAVPLFLQMQQIDHLEKRLEAAQQPQINTPIFELAPFRGSGIATAPPNLITLSSDPEWIVLAVAVSGRESSYRVELLTADERSVWKAAELRPDPLGRLIMTLPSSLLPAGDYELRVSSRASDAAPTAGFALRVDVGS